MNDNDFYLEQLEFLSNLKASSLYKETKDLSDKIAKDSYLTSLANERDSFYQSANDALPEEKEQLLIKAKEASDKLISSPLMKDYLDHYQKIKNILAIINDGIFKGINKQ